MRKMVDPWMVLVFGSLAGGLWAGPLHILGHAVPVVYHHEFNTAQIEGMSGIKAPSRNAREPGLTVFETEMSLSDDLEFESTQAAGPFRAWVKVADVDFSMKRLEVYISNQYPAGSCQYRAVLAHENDHVSINRSTYQRYLKKLKKELGKLALPTRSRPWVVRTQQEASDRVGAMLRSVRDRVEREFMLENRRLNAKIDTLASYRRVSAKCKNW